MLGLQDDPCIAFGVAAIHTAVRPSHDGFEASAEFAPDEVAQGLRIRPARGFQTGRAF